MHLGFILGLLVTAAGIFLFISLPIIESVWSARALRIIGQLSPRAELGTTLALTVLVTAIPFGLLERLFHHLMSRPEKQTDDGGADI